MDRDKESGRQKEERRKIKERQLKKEKRIVVLMDIQRMRIIL